MHKIYLVQNTENGKVYIGKTSKTLEERWKLHLKKVSGRSTTHFYNAIRKYGPSMFKIREIDQIETEQLANEREKYWIKWFQSYRPENGYNLTLGGDGCLANRETKQKISQSKIGAKNNNYGKTFSPKTLQKMSVAQTGKSLSEETKQRISVATVGEKNHFYGKQHSDVVKQKIRAARLGTHHSEETRRKISLACTEQKHGPKRTSTNSII